MFPFFMARYFSGETFLAHNLFFLQNCRTGFFRIVVLNHFFWHVVVSDYLIWTLLCWIYCKSLPSIFQPSKRQIAPFQLLEYQWSEGEKFMTEATSLNCTIFALLVGRSVNRWVDVTINFPSPL